MPHNTTGRKRQWCAARTGAQAKHQEHPFPWWLTAKQILAQHGFPREIPLAHTGAIFLVGWKILTPQHSPETRSHGACLTPGTKMAHPQEH